MIIHQRVRRMVGVLSMMTMWGSELISSSIKVELGTLSWSGMMYHTGHNGAIAYVHRLTV